MPSARGLGKIPLKGATGLLFVAVICILILIEVPASRWFLLGSVVFGGLIAAVLYFWNTRTR